MAAKGIHHLGVAVDDLDEAISTYAAALRCRAGGPGDAGGAGSRGSVACASGRATSSCSRALGADTPVGRFLSRRGPGMHHVAYEVDDLPGELARLEGEGAELIDASPRPGLFGMQVAFVHPDAPRTACSRSWSSRPWLSASASRSASTAARSWARWSTSGAVDRLEQALATGADGLARAGGRGRPLHGVAAADRLREALRPRRPRRFRRLSLRLWRSRSASSACRARGRRSSSTR